VLRVGLGEQVERVLVRDHLTHVPLHTSPTNACRES
jgi:hypothetical protein